MQDELRIPTKRNAAIDIARGIAIILVFLGHISSTPTVMRLWLQSFHMPLFFVCSGLVFSTKKTPTFKKFFIAQVRALVIPYFTFGISLYFLMCLAEAFGAVINGEPITFSWAFKDVIISLLLGYRQHERYFSLWFLTTMFIGKILFYFITKYVVKDHRWGYLGISVVFTAIQWLVFRHSFGFYWSMDLAPACVAFLSAGYFLKLSPKQEKYYQYRLLALIMPASIVLAILNFQIEGKAAGLYSCYMGNPVWYYLGAVVGSWMVLIIAHYISNNKALEYLGKNSLTLYAYQNSFSIVVSNMVIRRLAAGHKLLQDPTAQWLFVVFCSIAIGCVLVEIVNRFFPWFKGKSLKKN